MNAIKSTANLQTVSSYFFSQFTAFIIQAFMKKSFFTCFREPQWKWVQNAVDNTMQYYVEYVVCAQVTFMPKQLPTNNRMPRRKTWNKKKVCYKHKETDQAPVFSFNLLTNNLARLRLTKYQSQLVAMFVASWFKLKFSEDQIKTW